jgi:hypothetical protein
MQKISLLTRPLKLFDITWKACPNNRVFGLTTEGEEITQPCPSGGVFSGNEGARASLGAKTGTIFRRRGPLVPHSPLEIAQQQLRLVARLQLRALFLR